VILSDLYDFFQTTRERNEMRYFGCDDAEAGLPVLPGRERKAASATGNADRQIEFPRAVKRPGF
jgi:hypothetical protein